MAYLSENVMNLAQGYFFNEPTKSSLIGEKSPNLVTLNTCIGLARACPRCEHRKGTHSTWAVWKGLSENSLAY